MGSCNWMAPEQLLGGLLKKPCDIYALGMTIYEVRSHPVVYVEPDHRAFKIYTDEIPLGHITYADFIELVVQRNVRPEWPDDEDAPKLSDAIWEFAKACWVKDPQKRPTAMAVCNTISHLLENICVAQKIQESSPHPLLEGTSIAQPSQHASHSHPLVPPSNMTIRGHTASVWCAVFSPDGQIVSGSVDGTI